MVLENEILGETALNSKLKFIRKREQNWVFIVNVKLYYPRKRDFRGKCVKLNFIGKWEEYVFHKKKYFYYD